MQAPVRSRARSGEPAAGARRPGYLDRGEALYRQAAEHGSPNALYRMAQVRGQAGDLDGAKTLYQQAAEHPHALVRLAVMLERAGNRDGVEVLARQTADHGNPGALYRLAVEPGIFTRLWPHGLDPDSTPTCGPGRGIVHGQDPRLVGGGRRTAGRLAAVASSDPRGP